MINGTFHKRGFLSYLGEGKLIPAPPPIDKDVSCFGCNPSILLKLSEAPAEEKGIRAPSPSTRAGTALGFIQDWATEQARLLYPTIDWSFPVH